MSTPRGYGRRPGPAARSQPGDSTPPVALGFDEGDREEAPGVAGGRTPRRWPRTLVSLLVIAAAGALIAALVERHGARLVVESEDAAALRLWAVAFTAIRVVTIVSLLTVGYARVRWLINRYVGFAYLDGSNDAGRHRLLAWYGVLELVIGLSFL